MLSVQQLAQEKSAYTRVEAPCPHVGTCGGCALQDLAYRDQLSLKRERLQRALGQLPGAASIDLVGLDDPWRYRNKGEFTFSEAGARPSGPTLAEAGAGGNRDRRAGGRLILGYHAERSFWRIVDLDDCLLMPEPAMAVLRDVRRLAAQTNLPAYQLRTHQGFFRYALIRMSQATGNILVCLITTPGVDEAGDPAHAPALLMEELADELVRRHPRLTSFYWGVTARVADVAQPETLRLLRGSAYLEDRLGPFRLQLHPLSFLQPTSGLADRMYRTAAEALRAAYGGVAWDLYCGVGIIAFYLAEHFQRVYGIDIAEHHLELARRNAGLNGVQNVEFRAGPAEALLADKRFWFQEAKPQAIVVDPPRVGLHPRVLASLLGARPRVIAYFSCNAQSLVRDVRGLVSGFPRYRIAALHAFDLFPHTNHAEVLAILKRA